MKFEGFLTIGLILITAMWFPGVISRTKSILSGRRGPGVFQPIRDIRVLLRKSSVISTSTGLIFQIAPVIYLVTMLSALLLLPFNYFGLLSFNGDFVMFAYLIALGKFFLILGAMDTGSSFEGLGASREALYSMLIEPAFFALLGSLALLTGYTSFQEIFIQLHLAPGYAYVVALITVYLLIHITMVENSRLPVDDPKTHLELTMIHEVMVLDYSGFDMALIHITSYLKFATYGTIICGILIPADIGNFLQIGLFFIAQFTFAIICGILESFRARNRMTDNPQYILTLTAVALLLFLLAIFVTGKI